MEEDYRSLAERISALREAGANDGEILKILVSTGHHESDVRSALANSPLQNGAGIINLPAPRSGTAVVLKDSAARAVKKRPALPNVESFAETVQKTLLLYKTKAAVLTEIFIIPITALALSALFLNAAVTGSGTARFFWDGLAILGYLSSLVSLFLGSLAAIFALNGEGVKTEEAYWKSLQGAGGYAWIVLLFLLSVLGGLLLGIVPAVVFGVWFLFTPYVFADQSQNGLNALLRSKEYATGYWWIIFGRMLLLLLLIAFADALVGGISMLLGSGINYVVSLALQLVIVPFDFVFVYSIYSSLKAVKPELADKPVAGDRLFFVFVIVLGALAPFIVSALIR
ncbi:MAG: hypothetical protein M1153_00480 [Patescibacteria group bacterium]|nr:hypothetical protein [Patescibacteria group bacterium]